MTLDAIIPYLPHFQAILNSAATLMLGSGYYFIRQRQRTRHRNCMITALVVSSVFMVSYLTYHAAVGYMPFAGQGMIRPLYFTLLASHVILAAAIVPLVLITVYFALRGNFTRHPRIARWTLPLWLYVSVSGVVIYLLGFHVYPPAS
jgi:putative membrane protein